MATTAHKLSRAPDFGDTTPEGVMLPPTRVLVVTDPPSATPGVVEAVRGRAQRGRVEFHLVVPATPPGHHHIVDPVVAGRDEAEQALAATLPDLSAAAGRRVTGAVGDANPLSAIHLDRFEEIIVSSRPGHISRWLRFELSGKVRGLGRPIATT